MPLPEQRPAVQQANPAAGPAPLRGPDVQLGMHTLNGMMCPKKQCTVDTIWPGGSSCHGETSEHSPALHHLLQLFEAEQVAGSPSV